MFLSHPKQFKFPFITFVGRKLLLTLVAMSLGAHIFTPFSLAQDRIEVPPTLPVYSSAKPPSTATTKPLDIELFRKAVLWAAPGVDVADIASGKIQKLAVIDTDVYQLENEGIVRLIAVERQVRRELRHEVPFPLIEMRRRIEAREAELVKLAKVGCFGGDGLTKRMNELEIMKAEYKRQGALAFELDNARTDQLIARATAPVMADLSLALNDCALRNGINLILDAAKLWNAIVYVGPGMDITKAFVTGFNTGNYKPLNVPNLHLSSVNTPNFNDEKNGIRALVQAKRIVDLEFVPARNNLAKLDADIQVRTRELEKTTGPMADSAYRNRRVNELVELKAEYLRRSVEIEHVYKLRRAAIEEPLFEGIYSYLEKFAENRSASMIFDASVIGGGGTNVDLTETFIVEFNRLDLTSVPAR